MKKGFTMIELIFVIVILGILASVAIPRLAGTREDAEISSAIANLRTLISDAASYYVVKGEFGANTKWRDLTNVPLKDSNGNAIDSTAPAIGPDAPRYIEVGGKNCLLVGLRYSPTTTLGGYIALKPVDANNNGACAKFLATDSIRQLLESTLPADNECTGANNGTLSCVAISSGSIY
ncbi:type II secretion system protein [Campylobacter magnus]|uniref:type II secretion system protein n=1 Tax=Campylobacter magnus TaxID=3026462 RepID=UPI0026DF7D62|nr:type II secretion system protein [Campylobacter magnus]MDO2408072.1 type II secretion system protein [Campylobacter magnus]